MNQISQYQVGISKICSSSCFGCKLTKIISHSKIKEIIERMIYFLSGVDFEAMIDSENSKDSKDDKDSVLSPPSNDIEKEIVVPPKERTVIAVVVSQSQTTTSLSSVKPSQIVTYSRLPMTASSTIVTSKKTGVPIYSTAAAAAVHKKLVKDATQTAKVSIGSDWISVPILKNVPVSLYVELNE